MAVSPSLHMAADFFVRAGPGINIMASNIRFGQLDSGDWDGLASRVGHRRSPHATYGSANPADVAYQRLANASQLAAR